MDRLKQSFTQLRKNGSKAFTLIELLIVIGILGILAVTVLLTLNPAEAQRKARDLQRIKDATTIQAIVEQALNDGLTLCTSVTAGTPPCQSSIVNGAASTNVSQTCTVGTNWLGIDVCNYAKTVPADPQNGRTGRCLTSGVTANGTPVTTCQMEYYLSTSGAEYEINYKLESVANRTKLAQDGGNAAALVEIFSGVNTLIGNGAAGNY